MDIKALKKVDATQEQLNNWYKEGYTMTQIIGTLLSLQSVPVEAPKPKTDTSDEILVLRKEGKTYQQIADELGVSRQTVYNRLKGGRNEKNR